LSISRAEAGTGTGAGGLQLADERPPLTLAIHHAKAEDDPALPQWEADLARMVAEVTRKFHGALTAECVRRGLETSVGILGLGLLKSTAGERTPGRLLEALRLHGIRGASKHGVELVKECHALPESGFLFEDPAGRYGTSLQELLLESARSGYDALMHRIEERRAIRRETDLARWLLVHSAVGRLVGRNREGTVGDIAMADEVIFYILIRESGVPLPQDEMAQSVTLTPKPWNAARERYQSFVEKIPADLKPALFHHGTSWFDRVVRPSRSASKPRPKTAAKSARSGTAAPRSKAKAAARRG